MSNTEHVEGAAQKGEESKIEETDKPKVNVREMFEAYDQANDECEVAEMEFQEKQAAKYAAIKRIADSVGRGPFEWNGKKLTIMHRGDTYFFKGEVPAKVMKIE